MIPSALVHWNLPSTSEIPTGYLPLIDVSHRTKHSLEVVPSALVHRNVLSTGEILTKLRTLDRDISLDEAFI